MSLDSVTLGIILAVIAVVSGTVAVYGMVVAFRRQKARRKEEEEEILTELKSELNDLESYQYGGKTYPVTFPIAGDIGRRYQRLLREALDIITKEVASNLDVKHEDLRANIFALDSHGNLRIVPELTVRMNRESELGISLDLGDGSTGNCLTSGRPNIAVLREGWGEDAIDDEEMEKIHRDLQWIISVPVLAGVDPPEPFWVLNVDCVGPRIPEEELEKVASALLPWSYVVSRVVAKALTEGPAQ